MKVLITGAAGQLGEALQKYALPDAQVRAVGKTDLDITDSDAVRTVIASFQPDIVFNAAAFTAVDAAESEPEAAQVVNASAVAILARAAKETGARLVQVSTDYVFDGHSSKPYAADHPPNPISAYGRSKACGEVAAGDRALVVRTSWLYSAGHPNFVTTMLRLMRERSELRVVCDQIGSPTWAVGLAQAIWELVSAQTGGVYHYCDSGVASWFDFAVAIKEEAISIGLLENDLPIIPIASDDYPAKAHRPSYSVLDCMSTYRALGRPAPHWRQNLRLMLMEELEIG